MGKLPQTLIFSCEHAGNKVPRKYQPLFANQNRILETHEGWDIEVFNLAKLVAKKLNAPLFSHHETRLLVDVNRSLNSNTLFSRITNRLSEEERNSIIEKFYSPYREELRKQVTQATKKKTVVHYSLHSFTPVFKGEKRHIDIGILYHPKISTDLKTAEQLRTQFQLLAPNLRIEMNRPYSGISDGICNSLRESTKKDRYQGLELEFNQALLFKLKKAKTLNTLAEIVAFAISSTLKT